MVEEITAKVVSEEEERGTVAKTSRRGRFLVSARDRNLVGTLSTTPSRITA